MGSQFDKGTSLNRNQIIGRTTTQSQSGLAFVLNEVLQIWVRHLIAPPAHMDSMQAPGIGRVKVVGNCELRAAISQKVFLRHHRPKARLDRAEAERQSKW